MLDFGLAKVTEREMRPGSMILTQEGMVFGTPEFMSPEQAQGKILDARSDIYSLAVILYELLTGKLPFDARTPMEYIQFHVTKQPIRLDERVPGKLFDPKLADVLDKALEKKPESRYGSASEFADALKPFAGMAGKGFTAMMPKDVSQGLTDAIKAAKAAQVAVDAKGGNMTVKLSPGLVATTPAGQVPAALGGRPRRSNPTMSPLMLGGIAAACLVAGIVLTIVAMRLFG